MARLRHNTKTQLRSPLARLFSRQRADEADIPSQSAFAELFRLERKRAERSQRPFILMLLRAMPPAAGDPCDELCDATAHVLARKMRDTDVVGWYLNGRIVGVLFTEIGRYDHRQAAAAILRKVGKVLDRELSPEQVSRLRVALRAFPQTAAENLSEADLDCSLVRVAQTGEVEDALAPAGRVLDLGPAVG